MVARRIVIGVLIGLLSVLGVGIPALAQAGSTGQITVTSPASDACYAAYPLGSYNFPDRSGTFSPGLFEGSADPVTVGWQATGVSGDVTVTIILDGETVHTGAVAASTGAYTWQPAVGYGRSYSHYANCHAVVASLLDPAVAGTSSTFAIVPWGTVVQEWNGLAVYSNFPRPSWLAPGVDAIPWFGDSGAGFRYQCVELVQRWTTQTQHWQDKHGNVLPEHWAGLYAKDMLTVARGYGLPTVSNDHTATSPPEPGDLLVWGSGSYGHAAVVGAVEGDHLRVYEQNGANLQGTRTLALKRGSGTVWIDQEGVIGWIKPLQRYAFSDVGSSPYGQAIESLARAGIISGYPDGTFRPDAPVTRQQFAKMVVKSLGLPVSPSDDCPFVDVGSHMDPTDPLYPDRYVAVCAAHGITEGKTPTVFGPYDNMTRAQLITMVARAADLPEPPADFAPVFGNFSSDHYPWARKAAYAGLLDGLQGTGPSYSFWAPASRAEVAQILYDMMPLLPEVAEFQSSIQELDDALRTSMLASGSWSVAVPVSLEELRLLRVSFWGFDGRAHIGSLVVHGAWADDLETVFEKLYVARFPIRSMNLVDDYVASDERSMAADNTSAYNGRYVSGTTVWSMHAYGLAIDINPIENPWVREEEVSPAAGRFYIDRSVNTPGMIHSGDVVVRAFASIGWQWGGDWQGTKDYQHFSSNGR